MILKNIWFSIDYSILSILFYILSYFLYIFIIVNLFLYFYITSVLQRGLFTSRCEVAIGGLGARSVRFSEQLPNATGADRLCGPIGSTFADVGARQCSDGSVNCNDMNSTRLPSIGKKEGFSKERRWLLRYFAPPPPALVALEALPQPLA